MNPLFNEIYHRDLQPSLLKIDHLRLRAKSYLILTLITFSSIVLVPIAKWMRLTGSLSSDQLKCIAFGIALLAIICGAICSSKYKKYKIIFKQDVVKKLIETLFAGFQYKFDQFIKEETYRDSQLFAKEYARYKGEDYAFGKIGSADVEFSELHTQYRIVTTQTSGGSQEQWPTIFQGFFVHADFHKKLTSRVLIFPVVEDSIIGEVYAGALKKTGGVLETRGQSLKLDNPEFEKHFLVFADNLSQGQELLTPQLQESLLLLRKRFLMLPHASLIDGRLFIAVQNNVNHFEPRIWSAISKDEVFFFYEIFQALFALTRDVEQNNRI